ncbi:DUF3040 domain-containing protein [Actinomyces sp. ZJ308]|uniref:DUF3040 domain-containing protein n=1 Tax=Actinomyces sp. ZJ308 TaxID=2708342 RepID=UPI001422F088|nr:DUF3040 domain-containing protein [Actinomyces sp. ZJ308]
MALSEREQQVLRDLESQLHQDDPDLAQTLQREERQLSRLSPRHIGGGVALVLIGLALLIAGVSVRHNLVSILLGVAGFLVAVGGVALALTRVESASGSNRSATGGGQPGRDRSGKKKRSSFMDRQSERWERRRDTED